MDKWKNYRYLFLLLVGGLICSLLTGFPLELIKKDHGQDESEVVETISMSADTVDEDGKLHSDGESDLIAGGSDNNMDNNTNDDMKNNATGSMNDDMQNNTTGSKNDDMQNEEPEVPLSFCEVSDDYFDDAVFIGDSRVVSLYEYSDWKEATYYCSSGMTLGGVFKDPTGRWKDGNWKVNIADALQQKQYKKVYIMLGINDMGVGDLDYFMNHYTDMVNQIHEWQPDAIIYIMSIMNVSAERNAQGDYINNEAIRVRNERLKELDNGRNTFYLDINSVVCDENGYLNAEYTFDGVHLYAQYVLLWTDYLKTHAIVK
ncbi:MAG: GDSL-type esterase/lipase family protein [Lachnospiraceae bacterium]